jgi:hypothetical protein
MEVVICHFQVITLLISQEQQQHHRYHLNRLRGLHNFLVQLQCPK